jgi:hypothetical protein
MKVLLTDRSCERAPKLEGEVQSDDFGEELSALSVSKTKKTWTFHVTIVGEAGSASRSAHPGTHLAPSAAEREGPPGDCEAGRDPRTAQLEAGTFRAGCEAYARREGDTRRTRGRRRKWPQDVGALLGRSPEGTGNRVNHLLGLAGNERLNAHAQVRTR